MDNGKWWSGLWDNNRGKSDELLDLLDYAGIKLLVVDFDNTFLDHRVSPFYKGSLEALAARVRPTFMTLFERLLKDGRFAIAIATWNILGDLIVELLQFLFPNYDASLILVQDNPNPINLAAYIKGKEKHIRLLKKKFKKMFNYSFKPQEIFLLDDFEYTIKVAKKKGHLTYQVKDDVTMNDILIKVKEQLRVEN